MKRKLKIMHHHVDQLKDEIGSKEATLVKQHLEYQRMEKEKDSLKVLLWNYWKDFSLSLNQIKS